MTVSMWRRINARRDHRWARSRFSDYLDGELPERQRRRLAAHEEICPECGRVVRTLRRMIAMLVGARPEAGASGLSERTAREVRREIDAGEAEPHDEPRG